MVPADSLLLAGSCIVDESVLTGESTPQWKSPLLSAMQSGLNPDTLLDLKRDKAHVLFGGTKVVQHSGDKAAHIKWEPFLSKVIVKNEVVQYALCHPSLTIHDLGRIMLFGSQST